MAGVALATSDGTMKMPEPITEPTTTQSAATGPSTRGRVVSFGMVSVAMSAVSLPVRNVKGQGEDGQRLGVSRTVGTVVGAGFSSAGRGVFAAGAEVAALVDSV